METLQSKMVNETTAQVVIMFGLSKNKAGDFLRLRVWSLGVYVRV